MSVKVIFLDVDGVLNCDKTTRIMDDIYMFVDTRKVLRLRNIIERTGAKLVLSSSWRYGAIKYALPHDAMAYLLLRQEFRRLRCPLWEDCTPILPNSKREREIYAYLLEHPEIDNFIILDDYWQELEYYKDRLVVCNEHIGLTKERAELAISMLNEGEEQ